jgi:hypothetical protein
MTTHTFNLAGHGPVTFDIDKLVIAGWTGRDMAMVEHHIAELEAIGVARPKSVPTFTAWRRHCSPAMPPSRCRAAIHPARPNSCCSPPNTACWWASAPTIRTARWKAMA